jgi:hypothetical protein
MILKNCKQENIDNILEGIETMIDARARILHERQNSNYREMMKISEQVYDPAREKVKDSLSRLIDSKIPLD